MANCQYGCEVLKGEVRCQCPSPGLQLAADGRTCVGTSPSLFVAPSLTAMLHDAESTNKRSVENTHSHNSNSNSKKKKNDNSKMKGEEEEGCIHTQCVESRQGGAVSRCQIAETHHFSPKTTGDRQICGRGRHRLRTTGGKIKGRGCVFVSASIWCERSLIRRIGMTLSIKNNKVTKVHAKEMRMKKPLHKTQLRIQQRHGQEISVLLTNTASMLP